MLGKVAKETIVKMYNEGKSCEYIASLYNVSKEEIVTIIADALRYKI